MSLLALALLAPKLWIGPPETHAPFFPDELSQIRAAVVARIERDPDVSLVDGSKWEALRAAYRTRPDGPRCAVKPSLYELMEIREGAEIERPFLDASGLEFSAGEFSYEVPHEGFDAAALVSAIERAEGQPRSGSMGGRGFGMHGDGKVVVLFDLFGDMTLSGAAQATYAVRLGACHDGSPERDVHAQLSYRLAVSIAPDGRVERVEHLDEGGSARGRACLKEGMAQWYFPPHAAARRVLVHVADKAPEPLPRFAHLMNFSLEASPMVDRGLLYDEPRFDRCSLPKGSTAFEITVGPTGTVESAKVEAPTALRDCVETALRHVRFSCPDDGRVTLSGSVDVR